MPLPWLHLAPDLTEVKRVLPWQPEVPDDLGTFCTSSRYFLRALEMGFREFQVSSNGHVFQCHDGTRIYAWAGWYATNTLLRKNTPETEKVEITPPDIVASPRPQSLSPAAGTREAEFPLTSRSFPLRTILAKHPLTGWIHVFAVGSDPLDERARVFLEFAAWHGMLRSDQQLEILTRRAEERGEAPEAFLAAYVAWLTSSSRGPDEPNSEFLDVPSCIDPPASQAPEPTAEDWRQEADRRWSEQQQHWRREDRSEERRAAIAAEMAAAKERRRLRREEAALRRTNDITFLGRGVSLGLHNRRSDVARLAAASVPVLSTPVELADAMGLTIGQLRWLAYHSEVTGRVHYVSFTVPKKSGGVRTLHAPLHTMGRAQRWILDNILEKLPVEGPCHGFRAGHSTVTNAAPHAHQAVVINMDLAGFFPSIGFRRVRSVFERLGYSPAVSVILALVCTACPRREEMVDGQRRFVAIGPHGLPQGACTSPALANQVTRRLDRRLDGLAHRLGGAYTRYADDLSFSGGEELLEKIGSLMRHVRQIVREEGFVVNEEKTRVQRRHHAQVVTGLVVNDRPGVVRREVRRLRAILHRARHEGLDKQNREGRPNFLAWLRGKIGYVCMARPDVGAGLQSELNALLASAGDALHPTERSAEHVLQEAEMP